jgi:protein-tyrosine phosphatase
MIDIHCHLLPGVDDGPRDLNAALDLARALAKDRVRHAVCTPHVFPGRYDNSLQSLTKRFEEFQLEVRSAGIDLGLSLGAEVRLSPEVLPMIERGEIPFMGRLPSGQKTMLLEMPDGLIPVGSDRFIFRLREWGILPVIAHPERNRAVMDTPAKMRSFVDAGCLLQLTAGAVIGLFGARAKAASRFLLDQGWVAAVAGDSHNLSGRNPRMLQARAWLTQKFGREAAMQLLVTGPASIIAQPHLQSQMTRDSAWGDLAASDSVDIAVS